MAVYPILVAWKKHHDGLGCKSLVVIPYEHPPTSYRDPISLLQKDAKQRSMPLQKVRPADQSRERPTLHNHTFWTSQQHLEGDV